MAGPQDWGAVPVSDGPEKWGAIPVEPARRGIPDSIRETFGIGPAPPEPPGIGQEEQSIPRAFIDRIARGALIMRDMYGYTFDLGKSAGRQAIEGTVAQAHAVNDRLNPFSEAYQTGRESGAWTGPGTFVGVGAGLFDLAMLPLAPIGGALTEIVAKPYSDVTRMPIEKAREAAGMALMALRPSKVPNAAEFSRIGPGGEQRVGGLPRETDFATANELIGGDRATVEANLRRAWQEEGIHPSEAVHDAQRDPFLKHDLTTKADPVTLDPADARILEDAGLIPSLLEESAEGTRRSIGAAVNTDPPLVPLSVQPAPRPGTLMAALRAGGDFFLDIGRDIQMKVAPMATGTRDSMAIVKDFANTMRRNRWEWSRIDDDIAKRFTPEQRARMWNAADEESVARQLGESREHQGLVTLEPAERAAVEDLQARAQTAWLHARDLGMVEGEGLPSYTPRMLMNVAIGSDRGGPIPLNGIGLNLRTQTGNMQRRMYLTAEETEAAAKRLVGMRGAFELENLDAINAAIDAVRIARDIRALPLATARLEDAIAGRTLIENIKDYGKRTGNETVSEGAIPAGSDTKWFTLDHPAFRTWRPKLETVEGKAAVLKDADGNIIFEQVPLYVHGDFEGPLRAVLTQRNGAIYEAMMTAKAKTMSVIMYSPAIHNLVEFGRAFPAMPTRIFKVYFDGNRAKNDVAVMREAIDNGLVPIGKRFFNQDINSIMEAPDLTPGRSLTAKITAATATMDRVLPMTEEMRLRAIGDAEGIKRAVDKAGDVYHNTLLWDRIADLQMGLYVNFRGDMIAKGIDPTTSSRVAAHLANRYAGALPQEAMSQGATKVANFVMFSRSFTVGNWGVMKDMLKGLPRDVIAQIERDAGELNPKAAEYVTSLARRKAIATVAFDIGLLYIGNSILQSAANILLNDGTLDKEMHGYVRRARDLVDEVKMHPLQLLQPLDIMERLSATYDNEPGKRDRILIGYAKDGTAIYLRNPVGKIGEEFVNWFGSPIDMMKRKEGTIARPLLQVISNDKGFGRKIYDPTAETPVEYAQSIWAIVSHIALAQTPEGALRAGWDLVRGEGDAKVNALQAFGPFAGATFSRGAPGGPAVGEMYAERTKHDIAVQMALPDIRRQIQRGDIPGAQERMTALGIPGGLQKFYIKTSQSPELRLGGRTLRDFYRRAPETQIERLERARER